MEELNLPDLILLQAYDGNWDAYLEAIYHQFQADFAGDRGHFRGKRIGLKRLPMSGGREATFWHFISEGNVEADRTPDLRRCERIAWIRVILSNPDHRSIKTWSEAGDRSTRILLWYELAEFLVVLDDRGEFILPWTAYCVERDHQKCKLQARWEAATRNG